MTGLLGLEEVRHTAQGRTPRSRGNVARKNAIGDCDRENAISLLYCNLHTLTADKDPGFGTLTTQR